MQQEITGDEKETDREGTMFLRRNNVVITPEGKPATVCGLHAM